MGPCIFKVGADILQLLVGASLEGRGLIELVSYRGKAIVELVPLLPGLFVGLEQLFMLLPEAGESGLLAPESLFCVGESRCELVELGSGEAELLSGLGEVSAGRAQPLVRCPALGAFGRERLLDHLKAHGVRVLSPGLLVTAGMKLLPNEGEGFSQASQPWVSFAHQNILARISPALSGRRTLP